MKTFAFVSATCIALAAGFAAQAAPAMDQFEANTTATLYQTHGVAGAHPYDRCHGRSTGTADPACGSLTGGPAGSLF